MATNTPVSTAEAGRDTGEGEHPGASPRKRNTPLLALIGVITVLALAGGVLAIGDLVGSRGGASGSSAFHLTQDVATSFGVVAAESMETHTGPDNVSRVGKVTVAPTQIQVRVVVAITNEQSSPITYSPDQFTLLTDKGATPLKLSATSLTSASLQPRASIEGRLLFVAPPGARNFTLRFADPGRSQPILIELHY
jgi:Domain of unknown function (DUF4352)